MELMLYFRLFRKWFWLIFLGMFLAGGTAFLQRSREPEQYQAKATLLVGGYIESPNPNFAEIQTGVGLAQTYAALARTTDILEATIDAGEYPISPGQLSAALQATVVTETSLLELRVTYRDPVLAADMTNELAEQLILHSPTNLTAEQQRQIELATTEIERLNRELEMDRNLRSTVEAQLQSATDPAQIEQYEASLDTIASRINTTSGNVAQFQSTITALQRRTNSLDIVERARVPSHPIGSSVFMVTLLGAAVGGALGAGIALLIEYLDDTIHTADEATQILSIPNLGSIRRFGKSRDNYQERLVVYLEPTSPVAEEYRAIRTNLLFSANGHAEGRGFMISSAGPSEGKSITTANLAVAMATAGWRVLLIDADLRRPKVHEIFGLENKVGLSTLLAEDTNKSSGIDFHRYLQTTDVVGLSVITSGHTPINPTEILGSIAMLRRYNEFLSSKEFDIVLFDTSPILVVADGPALASTIKVPVAMVIEAGETRRGAALKAKERLEQLKIELAGSILNSVSPKDQGYGQGYSYYYGSNPQA